MKITKSIAIMASLAAAVLVSPVVAGEPEQNELAVRLSGSTFNGIYIRAGTPYSMQFAADGSLSDSAGRTGRWWVSDEQNYCRIWQDGPMANVETCMEVIIHNQRIAIYNDDEMVLEGELTPSK